MAVFGYNNGVYLLNDLCKSQYSNTSLGGIARSINLEDIEKHFTADGIAARNASSTGETQYGNTRTYGSVVAHTPHIYKNHDKNVTITPNNFAQLESDSFYSAPRTDFHATGESSLTITQTYYGITSQTNYYDDPNFHNLIFGTEKKYWLASRFVGDNGSNVAFGLRYVNRRTF